MKYDENTVKQIASDIIDELEDCGCTEKNFISIVNNKCDAHTMNLTDTTRFTSFEKLRFDVVEEIEFCNDIFELNLHSLFESA